MNRARELPSEKLQNLQPSARVKLIVKYAHTEKTEHVNAIIKSVANDSVTVTDRADNTERTFFMTGYHKYWAILES